MTATVHASVVAIGGLGILIRGPSGSGKSRLAFDLINAPLFQADRQAQLVADDRVLLTVENGALIARPPAELEGLVEIRGLGIRRCDFRPEITVVLVVDLAAGDAERMPAPDALVTEVEGRPLPRIPVGPGFSAVPLIVAALTTEPMDPAGLTLRPKV